jgi:hypothetical protein
MTEPTPQHLAYAPVSYRPTDTPQSLSSAQLRLLAHTKPDLLLYFIKERTAFDAEGIRLLLEMGIEAARARLLAMPGEVETDAN